MFQFGPSLTLWVNPSTDAQGKEEIGVYPGSFRKSGKQRRYVEPTYQSGGMTIEAVTHRKVRDLKVGRN